MRNLFSVKYRILHGSLILIIALMWTAFIFMQSTNNAVESTQESNKVVETVEKVCESVGIQITNIDSLTGIIRKSAHFIEFGILGALSFITIRAYRLKPLAFMLLPIGYCLAVATTDEYIQTFSSGRSCQVSDVLIDISGATFVILIFIAITLLLGRRKRKTLVKNSN